MVQRQECLVMPRWDDIAGLGWKPGMASTPVMPGMASAPDKSTRWHGHGMAPTLI